MGSAQRHVHPPPASAPIPPPPAAAATLTVAPPCTLSQLQVVVKAVAAEQAVSSTTGQPYGRVFNFSAGPAVLPVSVLEQAQADLLNWRGSGGWGWLGRVSSSSSSTHTWPLCRLRA